MTAANAGAQRRPGAPSSQNCLRPAGLVSESHEGQIVSPPLPLCDRLHFGSI